MQREELAFAAECMLAVGWVRDMTAALAVIEGFYHYDPDGCFIALQEDQPAGICVATPYKMTGFAGELIVRPDMRRKGIGEALLRRVIEYLNSLGIRSIYLDGVPRAVPLYERLGFRKICQSLRFSGLLEGRAHSTIRRMTRADLPQVCAFDREHFGDDRGLVLEYRMEEFPDLAHVCIQDGRVAGYIMGRRREDWVSVGPWVTGIAAKEPLHLLEAVAMAGGGMHLSLGVLESNHAALNLLKSLGFSIREDNPWRMVHGDSIALGESEACYAIGSAATG